MSRFNAYLYGFICCLPLGLILLIIGVPFSQAEATMSAITVVVLGIIILAIAAILLIIGLIKLGQESKY